MKILATLGLAVLLVPALARAQTSSASTSSSAGFSSGILGGSTQPPRSSPGPVAEYAPAAATSESTRVDGSARIVAYLSAGLGVGGIGVGAGFGIAAIARKIQSDKDCSGANMCSHAGLALQHAGQTDGDIATASLAGGAALLGTGVLLLVAPPRALTGDQGAVKSVKLAFSPSSIGIVGSF